VADLEFAVMQRYTVTTLDGGERIVTERVSSVRSVARRDGVPWRARLAEGGADRSLARPLVSSAAALP